VSSLHEVSSRKKEKIRKAARGNFYILQLIILTCLGYPELASDRKLARWPATRIRLLVSACMMQTGKTIAKLHERATLERILYLVP